MAGRGAHDPAAPRLVAVGKGECEVSECAAALAGLGEQRQAPHADAAATQHGEGESPRVVEQAAERAVADLVAQGAEGEAHGCSVLKAA